MRIGHLDWLGARCLALAALGLASTCAAEDWPHWRGPQRNGLTGESSRWDEGNWGSIREVWRANVGQGATSPVVAQGKVFLMGWADGRDRLRCLDLRSGKELWRQEYKSPRFGRKSEGDQGLYSGVTATPEFDAQTGRLYTLSTDGELQAWNTGDGGQRLWRRQLYDEFDVPKRPRVGRSGHRDYGYTSSPLVLGDAVIVEVGASSGNLVAFDGATGQTRWQSQNKSPAGHNGGAVPMLVEGIPCVAVHQFEGLLVARIDRGREGETIAEYPWKTDFANNIASLTVAGDSVVMTSHYNQERTARLRISRSGAAVVWERPLASKVCSPLVLGEDIYLAWQEILCLDFATGNIRWRGGRTGDPGSCIGTADGRLVVWSGNGALWLVESAARSPDKLQVLAERQVLSQTDAWPHVALADGHILCKDRRGDIVCLSLEPQ